MSLIHLSNSMIGVLIYLIGVATPGVSNLAIADISMMQDRRAGLIFATGVLCGSLCWGMLAAAGLSALILSFSKMTDTIKIVGAIYLFWLGFKALKAGILDKEITITHLHNKQHNHLKLYLQGMTLHLTNPKAIIIWLTVVAVGLPVNSPVWTGFALVAVCGMLGIIIFALYAILFSAKSFSRFFILYQKQLRILFALCYFILAGTFIKLIYT